MNKEKGCPYTELDFERDMARESIDRMRRYEQFNKNLNAQSSEKVN